MEEEKEQGRGVWRLDCGAMVGWFARSQVAGGPKDADCCCCLLKVLRIQQGRVLCKSACTTSEDKNS